MSEPMATPITLDIHAVLAQLPHRYPFLLVDRVLEAIPGKSLKALKNVTINEPFFQGHFPSRKVMPGVLQLEALILNATFVRAMRGIWKFSTSATVDGLEVCSADMMVAPEARG